MLDLLETRGVDVDKIRYTPNWAIQADVDGQHDAGNRRALGLPAQGSVFLYAGNLGQLQCLDTLVTNWPDDMNAHLVLMGQGVAKETLRALAASRPNVRLLDAVPSTEVNRYLRAADALVVSLADTSLLRATMPSKMQASLAVGRPILVHGAGDVAELVATAGAGRAATPGAPGELANAVNALSRSAPADRATMGDRAASLYQQDFSQSNGSRRIVEMLQEAANGGG
jgi:glycosyltransferase involved in cell wall biosynthesis